MSSCEKVKSRGSQKLRKTGIAQIQLWEDGVGVELNTPVKSSLDSLGFGGGVSMSFERLLPGRRVAFSFAAAAEESFSSSSMISSFRVLWEVWHQDRKEGKPDR